MPTKSSAKRESFVDRAPEALGQFGPRESLLDVQANGWLPEGSMAYCGYLAPGQSFEETLLEERNEIPQSSFLRRRLCDGFSLQSKAAREFEKCYRKTHGNDYFPNRYKLASSKCAFEDSWQAVQEIAAEEFRALDYLQPLASILQVIRKDLRAPFITRCWDFGQRPGAIIKTARMQLAGSDDLLTGSCICYEPPEGELLKEAPNNYLIFRNVAGHVVGHHWWKNGGEEACPTAAADIRRATKVGGGDSLRSQAISLFSIFLIMYRGAWKRQPLRREQLENAFDLLGFETRWARANRTRIIAAVKGLEFRKREFEPRIPDLREATGPLAEHQLSNDAILEIRDEASRLVQEAHSIPFASTAAVIGLRKLDIFISFELDPDLSWPELATEDMKGRHLDAEGIESTWREYRLRLPEPAEGHDLSLANYLEVARLLAHIRLHGRGYEEAGKKLINKKAVEREYDTDADDRARFLAMALYAQDGQRQRVRMSFDLAKFLLSRDPSQLSYLIPYADDYFQWCCVQDSEPAHASQKFLAKVREVGSDEVHLTFWGEDAEHFRTSLPFRSFQGTGIEPRRLHRGSEFKLFLVPTQDGTEVRPMAPSPVDPNWSSSRSIA